MPIESHSSEQQQPPSPYIERIGKGKTLKAEMMSYRSARLPY